jgi:hypothetical protein
VLFEVDQSGVKGEPIQLPLSATPLRKIEVCSQADVDALVERYPEPQQDIVEVKIIYKPGEDNPDAMRDALEKIFPRWSERRIEAEGSDYEMGNVEGISASYETCRKRFAPISMRNWKVMLTVMIYLPWLKKCCHNCRSTHDTFETYTFRLYVLPRCAGVGFSG